MTCKLTPFLGNSPGTFFPVNFSFFDHLVCRVVPLELYLVRSHYFDLHYPAGVGYLDDGTMVVVEDGRDYIGQTVEVTVSKVLALP